MATTQFIQDKLLQIGQDTLAAAGKSVPVIAKELDLNVDHLYRWLASSEGVQLLYEAVETATEVLRRRLPNLVELSLDELETQLTRGDYDVRARAAKIILSTAARLPTCDCRRQHATTIINHQ